MTASFFSGYAPFSPNDTKLLRYFADERKVEYGAFSLFFSETYICYKPAVFQPLKMFGCDFETYLTETTVKENFQFL